MFELDLVRTILFTFVQVYSGLFGFFSARLLSLTSRMAKEEMLFCSQIQSIKRTCLHLNCEYFNIDEI